MAPNGVGVNVGVDVAVGVDVLVDVGGGVTHAVVLAMIANRVGVDVTTDVVAVVLGQGPPHKSGFVKKKSQTLPPVQYPEGSV